MIYYIHIYIFMIFYKYYLKKMENNKLIIKYGFLLKNKNNNINNIDYDELFSIIILLI